MHGGHACPAVLVVRGAEQQDRQAFGGVWAVDIGAKDGAIAHGGLDVAFDQDACVIHEILLWQEHSAYHGWIIERRRGSVKALRLDGGGI